MRAWLGVFCMALSAPSLLGCSAEPREVRLALVPPEALGCRATEVTALRVSPLGDFPTEVRPTISLEPGGEPVRIDRFPTDTRWVRIEAEGRLGASEVWLGGGLVPVTDEGLNVPLLRLRRGCALSDPTARVPEGAVALALADGRLLVAGGFDEGAQANIVLVRPGERLADGSALRLFTPRTEAGGTVLEGGRVLIAGGAIAAEGGALDTVEVFRVLEDEEAALDGGFLQRARRAPALAALPDGTVLVVGGRDGGAVGDAERLTVGDTVESESVGASVPRWGAEALALDDGTVLIVGGEDETGPSAAIEHFDGERLERLDDLPARAQAAWVALPGARALRVVGEGNGVMHTGSADLLLDGGRTRHALGVLLEVADSPTAVALSDGQVLVTSRGAEGMAHAQVLDPGGTRTSLPVEPSRVASRLLQLVNGTLVEANALGVSLLRLDVKSPFDDPQASLFPAQADQRTELSLDAAANWVTRGDLLLADVDGARLDLPTARFQSFRAELEVEGLGAVLLDADGAPPHRIELDEDTIRLGDCEAPRPSPLVIERRGRTVMIGDVSCSFDEADRVALGLSMSRGAGVRRLSISRQ